MTDTLIRITTYRAILFALFLFGLSGLAWGQNSSSDAAYARGVELYGIRKYADAIPFFQKADSLERLEGDEETTQTSNTVCWIANCYYQLGNEDKARETDPYSYTLAPIDRRLTKESDNLADIGFKLMQEGNYEGALEYFRQSGDIEKSVLGEDAYYYGNTLSIMAECYHALADFDTAFSKANSALKIHRLNGYDYGVAHCYELLGLISENIEDKGSEGAFGYYQLAYDKYSSAGYRNESVNVLVEMASVKQNMGEVKDAYELCIKAKEIIDKYNLFADFPGSYAYLLSILGQAEFGLFMYKESFEHFCEAKRLFEEDDLEVYHVAYIMNMSYRAFAATYILDCNHHDNIIKEAYETFISTEDFKGTLWRMMIEELYYRCNPDNIPTEQRIAAQRRLLNEFEDAEGYKSASYLEILTDILNECTGEEGVDYVTSLYHEIDSLRGKIKELSLSNQVDFLKNLSVIEYSMLNNPRQAMATLTDGIDLLKREGWQYNINYCKLLNHIAQMHIYTDSYSDAFEYLKEAMLVYSIIDDNVKDFDVYHTDEYVNTLIQLLAYYEKIGDLKQYDEYFNKIDEINPLLYSENDMMFIYKLCAITRSDKSDTKKVKEIIGVCRSRLNAIEKAGETNSFNYTCTSLIYSGFLALQGDTKEAEKIISETRKYINSNFVGTLFEQQVELNCALLLMFMGDVDEATSIYTKVLPTIGTTNSLNIQDLSTAYQNIVSIYGSEGKFSDALPYVKKTLDIYKDILNNNFRSMSYQERSSLWEKFSGWFVSTLPTITYRANDSTMDEYLYDGLLLSKGLLLNSEIELRKLVASSGDEYSLALCDQLQILYAQQKRAVENPAEYERISREITIKERELANSVKPFGDYTKNLTLTWEDVRNGLSPKEAAIEFVMAPVSQDSIVYSALVLRSGTSPKRVNLCSQQELTAIPSDSLYTSTTLSRLIWEPLSEVLAGTKDVYFSPQGILHSMAIEYSPISEGGYISDRYNMYRLSSTREKVLSHNTKGEQSAVLYGGLSYDADTTAVMRANDGQTDHCVFKPRAAVKNIRDVAQGISDLRYTLEEVEDIDSMYSIANEECYTFKGVYGTEESFKKLSGTGKTLLHLATHGFYYTETDYKNGINMMQVLDILGNTAVSFEDKMLTCSGLFLSGANLALTNQDIPNNMEDGILTAQEISLLDFRDVDLVVLSACKSAMGELVGDGVFGLQRGFKKAGVHTLLMSLWNVDDRATKLLMTEFYRNWLGVSKKQPNVSKREAFLKAQEYLRTIDNGMYKNPKYWAAFIMLDGIN